MSNAHPNSRLVRRFSVECAEYLGRVGFAVSERIPHSYGYTLIRVAWSPSREKAKAIAEDLGVLLPEGWTG